MKQLTWSKAQYITITLIAAVLGGLLFKLFHIPVPWLLGPMVVMAVGTNVLQFEFVWPREIRNGGMIIVGYTIGLSMTAAALHEMAFQLPFMLLMTLLLMLLCAGIAYIVSKFSDSDYRSALLGSIPGGLTQVLTLAEETEGINLAVVTVTQVVRLMMIIIFIPLLVMLPIFAQNPGDGATASLTIDLGTEAMFPNIIIFAIASILLAIGGAKINFPTAYLLGPIIGTAILQIIGLTGPQLPASVINAAQLMIGTHVGMMLRTNQIARKTRTISLAVGSGLMLLIGSIILSMLLTGVQSISKATGLLSLAPGGMDQMGIIAHEIGADLSIVSGYQLFRSFFIYFAVPPLLKLIFSGRRKGIDR